MSCNCDEPNKEELTSRRGFLTKFVISIGGLIGLFMAFPLVTAMLDPITRRKKQVWRPVGSSGSFKLGETKMVSFRNASPYKWSGKMAYSAAYVRREQADKFVAFSVNCAHLGCPVRWVEKSELFLCPCHGGVYYKDGSYASGPPPRGLYTYPIRVNNNQVEIQTEGIPITTLNS